MTATSNAQRFLRVPLRLQAMCLDDGDDDAAKDRRRVVRAMADYRRLPFRAGGVDYDDNPNLSEHILAPPFSRDLPLLPGIHLHWLLPDALARGEHEAQGTRFPHVPNRWLILRSGGGQPERQWVVESDYLYPEGWGDEIESEGEAPVNVMAVPDPAPGEGYRYRFLGRALPLAEWRTEHAKPENDYLAALTAVGPETEVAVLDPVRATFASFYPNCRTVFGFRDEDFPTRTPPAGLRYDVIGWYGDPPRDCLAPLLAAADTPAKLKALLEEKLEWTLAAAEPGEALPQATLFHARLTFAPGARAARDVVRDLPPPALAVGQTETEALAAYLAYLHAPESNEESLAKRRLIEDQLEALQLADRLEGHRLDLDAILYEARHERGFASHAAGVRWAVQPETEGAGDLFARLRRAPARAARAQPPEWAGLLEALNTLQDEHQRALDELEHLRQRMYVRWHALVNAREVVGVNFFEGYVVPVRRRRTSLGQLALEQDEATGGFRARVEPVVHRIVSRLSSYYADYVASLNAGAPFDLDESGDDYWVWPVEFPNCIDEAFKLSADHTVVVLQRDEAWEIHDRGVVYPVRADAEGLLLEIPPPSSSIARRLAAALEALQSAVLAYNATEAGAAAPFAVRTLPAAPYYEPADPVLLITGEAAAGAIWKGGADDDLLPCDRVDAALDLAALPDATVAALQAYLAGLGEDEGNVWAEPPWNPFLMHWSFHVASCGRDENGDYDPELVRAHYKLDTQAVDHALLPGQEDSFSSMVSSYTGVSLLTPSAGLEVRERLVHYLDHGVLQVYYEEHDVPDDERGKGYLEQHFAEIKAWYLGQTTPAPGIEDPVFTALWAYEELERAPCLAQSLGNFNKVLLLREPTMQLGIALPTARDDSEDLFYTDTARDAMGRSIQRRPLAFDRFNPLRAGAMSITGLTLVDTFGQAKDVVDLESSGDAKVITTTDQTPSEGLLYHVLLTPRLSQPARLRFEWLPAEPLEGARQRTSEHPDTNPVCGFLLVNTLDGALAVYDKEGRALGALDRGNTWRTAPESGGRVRMDARGDFQLPNAHLDRVVKHVRAQGPDFLRLFLSAQRTALDTIDPEANAANPGRALLVARPVAVVRAAFALELQGPPAFDPSAVADVTGEGTTTTRGLEQVKIPVRLGEFAQLDDGLVGYFLEQDDGSYAEGVFYSPQLRAIGHDKIHTYADGSLHIERTPDGPEQRVTMLLDPGGQVHATTGVLPSSQLRLAPAHYREALDAMEVSFLTAPLLTDQGALRLEVPRQPGHVWSWVTQEAGGDWAETSALAPPNARAAFAAPQELREGWLMLRRTEGSGG
ncbi:hypothetical protein [Sorangium sp. So ce385]|uniref:hypothetical protein n=1 Tax=Sorangium sp. So ce385 TaxID=3133308 RepID=UPI003F5AE99C